MQVQLVVVLANRAYIDLLVGQVAELALLVGCNDRSAYRRARSAYFLRLALLFGCASLCLLVADRHAETERSQAVLLAIRRRHRRLDRHRRGCTAIVTTYLSPLGGAALPAITITQLGEAEGVNKYMLVLP